MCTDVYSPERVGRGPNPTVLYWPVDHVRSMDESRLWGGLGVVLAVVGLAIFAPELAHLASGETHGFETVMLGLYSAGVVLAAVVTALVIVPNLRGGASSR